MECANCCVVAAVEEFVEYHWVLLYVEDHWPICSAGLCQFIVNLGCSEYSRLIRLVIWVQQKLWQGGYVELWNLVFALETREKLAVHYECIMWSYNLLVFKLLLVKMIYSHQSNPKFSYSSGNHWYESLLASQRASYQNCFRISYKVFFIYKHVHKCSKVRMFLFYY